MLSTTPPQTYDTCPEYPGGKSWDKVPGQTGSGKKFHRNVISGADFTAEPRELDVMVREWESLNAKAELARMHRDGHCHEAMMWYVHHLPESMKTPRWKQAVPRWKSKKGDDPKTDHTKVTTRTPGWQPEETEALTAKAGYDCLNNATVLRRPEAVVWAPLVGQAR